jgi:hypothetical protein
VGYGDTSATGTIQHWTGAAWSTVVSNASAFFSKSPSVILDQV